MAAPMAYQNQSLMALPFGAFIWWLPSFNGRSQNSKERHSSWIAFGTAAPTLPSIVLQFCPCYDRQSSDFVPLIDIAGRDRKYVSIADQYNRSIAFVGSTTAARQWRV